MNKIKKIVVKSLVLFFLTLFFLSFALFIKIKILKAQVPSPYVPCDETRPTLWPPSDWFQTEFHSLRPYQASPCNQQV